MTLNPVPVWPVGLDALPEIDPDAYQDDDGVEADLLINKHSAILELLQAAFGISESLAQNTPLADTVLTALTNGKFKWGKVLTAMLAANAVTQTAFASGSSSGPTTTSTSLVNLTDMANTLTTVGGDLITILVSSFQLTSANNMSMGLRLDSGSDVSTMTWSAIASSGITVVFTIAKFTGVSATSHTVNGRWSVSTGTGTATGVARFMLTAELKK